MTLSPAMLWQVFYYTITLGTLARAFLRENRTPDSRIAWAVVVVALPFAGALIYVMFGEVDLGRQISRRLRYVLAQMKMTVPEIFLGIGSNAMAKINPYNRSVFYMGSSINGYHPVGGNRFKLMQNQDDFLMHLFDDIDQAQSDIEILYYIWLPDEVGLGIADRLINAASRGLACRILVDALGSRDLLRHEIWEKMRAAGIQAEIALPFGSLTRRLLMSRVDLRNHRKITVIDQKITYIGSQNFAHESFYPKKRYAPWVDIMARAEGPIVAQNHHLFLSDWLLWHDEPLGPLIGTYPDAHKGNAIAAVVADGPTERPDAMSQLLQTLCHTARHRLTLTTPYFVPSIGLIDALEAQALRGIDVSLVLPKSCDSYTVAMTSQSYYRRLLRSGVKVFHYRAGLLHSKTITTDRGLCFMGSTNLDRRSFDLNYENNMLIEDDAFCAAVYARQCSYIEASDMVTLESVEAWPYYQRIIKNAIGMISPIL